MVSSHGRHLLLLRCVMCQHSGFPLLDQCVGVTDIGGLCKRQKVLADANIPNAATQTRHSTFLGGIRIQEPDSQQRSNVHSGFRYGNCTVVDKGKQKLDAHCYSHKDLPLTNGTGCATHVAGNVSYCEYAPSPTSVRVPTVDGSYSMFITSLSTTHCRNDPDESVQTCGISLQMSHEHLASVNEPTDMLLRPPCTSSTPQILDFAAGVIHRVSWNYLEDPASSSDQMLDTFLMQPHSELRSNGSPNIAAPRTTIAVPSQISNAANRSRAGAPRVFADTGRRRRAHTVTQNMHAEPRSCPTRGPGVGQPSHSAYAPREPQQTTVTETNVREIIRHGAPAEYVPIVGLFFGLRSAWMLLRVDLPCSTINVELALFGY